MRARWLSFVLFAVTALVFLCSLQLFVPAPTAWLLIGAIILGEWGHYAAFAVVIVALIAWRRGLLGRITAAFAMATAIICLSPAIRAWRIARDLPARCDAAFGEREPRTPFSWTKLFLAARDDARVTEHTYAKDGDRALKFDLYQPEAPAGPQPVVLVVHGGSWARSSKEELPAINRHLAAKGYAVAALNYRHAPKWKFPTAVEDAFRVLDYLKAHAAELQLDVSRVVLMGRSAGGQIALVTAYAGREPAIRGVIAFYPPTDLRFGYEHPSARYVIDSQQVLEDYLGGTPSDRPAEYRDASAVNLVSPTTPPTLLIHGALDSVVWPVHSAMLAQRLEDARVPHLYLSLGWATHGCDANLHGPSGQLSLYAIDRFLATVLR
jgi:acetyl esterase/lipase